jgi:hypothetical protein
MSNPTPTRRRWIRRGAAIAAAAGSLALAPAAVADAAPAYEAETCAPTTVRSAELVPTTGGPAILVTGVAPAAGLRLELRPENITFIRQPEYWPYEVVGCGIGATVITPYRQLFRVPKAPVGTEGIQVGPSKINLP